MTDRIIADLWSHLEASARDDPQLPSSARAFASWIGDPPRVILDALTASALAYDGPIETAYAASLGYASGLAPAHKSAFVDALEWMKKREYFKSRVLSFEVDGYRLLGLAVGINALPVDEQSAYRPWLAGLTVRSVEICREADWNSSLVSAAHYVVSGDARTLGEVSADLQLALAATGLVPRASAKVREQAYEIITRGHADGMPRAAVHAKALRTLFKESVSVRFDAPTIAGVAQFLTGVSRSMKRWAWDETPRTKTSPRATWEIANEYHVQDMLWAILAPVFPDLDDEEWLASLGFHHPRADLAIPSLNLIIEVKFLRKATTAALSEMTTQVAADASTYLQKQSPYRHMIAFIWDDTSSTEKHDELKQGLVRITGVSDAIILPRPARMRHKPSA